MIESTESTSRLRVVRVSTVIDKSLGALSKCFASDRGRIMSDGYHSLKAIVDEEDPRSIALLMGKIGAMSYPLIPVRDPEGRIKFERFGHGFHRVERIVLGHLIEVSLGSQQEQILIPEHADVLMKLGHRSRLIDKSTFTFHTKR